MSLQFVIDGYNIIKHPLLASTSRKDKQERLALIELINAHKLTGSPNNRVVIVFDGYPDSEFPERGLKGIDIIFSREQSADERIKAVEEFIGPKVNKRRAPQPLKPELSYSQAEGINRELRKLWLGE